jgi:ABC-type branched-subunit amino acid transport system substrate-binding protein
MSRRSVKAFSTALLVALALTACGTSSKKGAPETPVVTQPAKPCPGKPFKFTTIAALSGPLGSAGSRLKLGSEAAVKAINHACALGRPLQVTLCDDQGDDNANLACGRQAASDGSLAILGSIGSFDDGVTASKLPAIFVNGTSPFELTNPKAYSSISGIALGMSGVSAVKALGEKSSSLLLPDTPTLQFAGNLLQQVAARLDVKVFPIYFPQDTTDFAPIAAQISDKNADAIGLLPINPVVVVNALAAEGLTPAEHTMVVPSAVITPDVMKELGPALNGMLVVSQTAPPSDTNNPGIQQFRADVQAEGHNPDDPDVDFATVTAWSNVKRLEGALLAMTPAARAALTSNSLVDTIVAHPIDRPESAPYDFRKNQIPELPSLGSFRVFTRRVAILRIEDGHYKTLTDGFIDIFKPPSIK